MFSLPTYTRLVLFWLIAAGACPAASRRPGSESLTDGLKKGIESILTPGRVRDLKTGVVVVSVKTGETLYEKNPDDLLIPASVNKVFTAYAALKKLRPTGVFKTTVYTVGPLREGKLSGDVVIKGGGDPSLVSERMWMLVNDFKRTGVKYIAGNVIVDSSYFDAELTPESRPKYLKDQAYNAPIGGLSFNFNTTTVYVRPGDEAGQAPKVYTDPENTYIEVVNQATTGKAGSKNTVNVNRTEYVKGDIGDTVLLRGSIPLDHHELRFYRNIVNPSLYAGHMFKTFMEQRGIKVQGNVVEGPVPGNARQVLEFDSQPLWQVIWGMNKFSNNFVADQILKKLGAEMWGAPGTLQKGVMAVQDVLEGIGIKRDSYVLCDGCGLTRSTRFTPRQIVRTLVAAYNDFSVSSEFVASLGISGEDGTLRNRFPSSSAKGAIRAKTGSLDGVNTLAGYVTSQDEELLAFAIMLNDPKGKQGSMTGWVDQIALAISRFTRKI